MKWAELENGRIISNKLLADWMFRCLETAGRWTISFKRIKDVW